MDCTSFSSFSLFALWYPPKISCCHMYPYITRHDTLSLSLCHIHIHFPKSLYISFMSCDGSNTYILPILVYAFFHIIITETRTDIFFKPFFVMRKLIHIIKLYTTTIWVLAVFIKIVFVQNSHFYTSWCMQYVFVRDPVFQIYCP